MHEPHQSAMADVTESAVSQESPDQSLLDQNRSRFAVTGGILGSLGISSCCLLPLLLTLFGISGAWMGNLRVLASYQPYFIGVALLALGYGFYLVYWKPSVACADGDACSRPMNNTLVKSGLWLGSLIALTSVSFSYWFPFIVPYLP